MLINNKESIGLLNYLNHSKAFTEYSNCMDDIYENIEEYNRNKKRKTTIVFEDVIADMVSNKKLILRVTELFV